MPEPRTSASVEMTVVVVTHNSSLVLRDCIAVLPCALEGVTSWSLVVVDNASEDDTVELAAEVAPTATVVELSHNAGYAAAINAAIAKAARSEHVVVLNPDVRLEVGSVRRLLTAVQRPGVGIAVPRLTGQDGELQRSLRRTPTVMRALGEAVLGGRRAAGHGRLGEVVGAADHYDYEHPTDWATGAVMLFSRRCFDDVGPWDESFFLYSEETDFALRARDADFLTWYTPAARATHIGGESNTSPRLWSILTSNRVRLFAKRHGIVRSSLFRLAVIVNEALRAAGGSPTHRAALRALLGTHDGRPTGATSGLSAAGGARLG